MQHADLVADRRRLKRSLSLWRILAIVVLAGVGIWFAVHFSGMDGSSVRPHIATIHFDQVISDDEEQIELVEEAAENDAVKAVILVIDSPGGTVTGTEILYRELAALAGRKPLVSVFRGMGTSGAYAVGLSGERLFAQETSIVGSIGVVFQWAEVSQLMQTLGVDVNSIKSSPLKAEPQPFDPVPPEARAMIERLVRSSLDWFVSILAQNRPFDEATAQRLADGAVYTGNEALRIGLVDEIGGVDEARAWLAANKGLDADMALKRLERREENPLNPLNFSIQAFADVLGFSIQSRRVSSSWGLMAIWNPGLIEGRTGF